MSSITAMLLYIPVFCQIVDLPGHVSHPLSRCDLSICFQLFISNVSVISDTTAAESVTHIDSKFRPITEMTFPEFADIFTACAIDRQAVVMYFSVLFSR